MEKSRYLPIGFSIILTLLFMIFTMGQRGCDVKTTSEGVPDLIEVEMGKTFTISLTSNPTTGYSWQPEFDSDFLELANREFTPDPSPLVGAPGVETFEFPPLKLGEVTLTMMYKRPWEDQPIDERTTLVKIVPATTKP